MTTATVRTDYFPASFELDALTGDADSNRRAVTVDMHRYYGTSGFFQTAEVTSRVVEAVTAARSKHDKGTCVVHYHLLPTRGISATVGNEKIYERRLES